MKQLLTPLLTLSLTYPLHAATVLEDLQLNDSSGTTLSTLTNGVAGSTLSISNAANVTTNGTGNLRFDRGTTATDNVFRNATLSNTGLTTGVYELSFRYANAFLSFGDNTGANVGFGIREDASNTDLFLVRLHKQAGNLQLQTRVGTTNTTLIDFGNPTVADLEVRAIFNLDTDMIDVFWSEPITGSGSSTGISINDLQMDELRIASNTNTNDFGFDGDSGVSDFVEVDYLTLTSIPEPSSISFLGLSFLSLIARRKR